MYFTLNHNHNTNTYLGIIPIAFKAAATNSEQKKDSCSAVDVDVDESGEATPPLFVSFDRLRNTPPTPPLPVPLLPLRSGGVLADAVKKKEVVLGELFGDGRPPEAVPSSQSSVLWERLIHGELSLSPVLDRRIELQKEVEEVCNSSTGRDGEDKY
jgi:hypothetical protein